MKTYTIYFMVDGDLTVQAESEEEALAYLESEDGQEAIGMILSSAEIVVTEIVEEDV